MRIGYARVSTLDQNADLQLQKLKEAGCEKVVTEKASGAKADRPGLAVALAYLREGAPATPSCTSSPAWSRR